MDHLEFLCHAQQAAFNVPVLDENGEEITRLNGLLIERRGISDEIVKRICRSHVLLHKTMVEMKNAVEKEEIRRLADRITRIEFIQQKLWGFTRDSTYHNWYNVPHCSCPKSDNALRKGTAYQIKHLDCIVHGD